MSDSPANPRPCAVVVGAGPGIGTSVARSFADRGFDVALVGRDEKALAAVAAGLDGRGVDIGWAPADVGDEQGLTEVLQRFARHTGRIDALHHNVSRYRPATASEITPADLLEDLAVGAASLLTAVRAVLPWLREAAKGPVGATVLATGSGAADGASRGAATLGVQKAALRALVRTLAADLASDGIHVATLTVRGNVADGTPFAADVVAGVLAELADESAGPREGWRTIVDLVREGPVTVA